jgi:hypothetical protein
MLDATLCQGTNRDKDLVLYNFQRIKIINNYFNMPKFKLILALMLLYK